MIVFFDSVCGLCNGAVDFLLARSGERMQFAPLQGPTAARRLPADDIADLSTVVVIDGDQVYRRSDAILHALTGLDGAWPLVGRLLSLIPRFARDAVYRVVASTRYSVFGRRSTCRLPSPEERRRFLD